MSSGGFREQRRADEFEANPGRVWAGGVPQRNLPQVAWDTAKDYLRSIYNGVTAAGRVMNGQLDPLSDEGVQAAFDMAGGVTLGPAAMPARAAGGAVFNAGARRVRPPGKTPTKVFPEYAEAYPPVPPPELKVDPKKGTEYLGKGSSPETDVFMRERAKVQRDIDAGQYKPYFDPAQRTDVDPLNYPTSVDTRQIKPKTPAKAQEHLDIATDPAALERLDKAYQEGSKLPDAQNWYFMGQLEKKFIEELGPEAGRKAFQEKFAHSMASTTGGADPQANLLMAMYANYQKQRGLPAAARSYEVPVPIGGRYGSTNLKMFDRSAEKPFGPGNPKRHDFEHSFLGHADKPVIDEQMTGMIIPGKAEPPWYGTAQEPVFQLSQKHGVEPRAFQDTSWAGAKRLKDVERKVPEPFAGQPMISVVNEAIERTARLTGLSPDEVMRRGIIRSEIPVYSQAIPGNPIPAAPQYQQGPPMPEKPPMPTWWRKKMTGSDKEFI